MATLFQVAQTTNAIVNRPMDVSKTLWPHRAINPSMSNLLLFCMSISATRLRLVAQHGTDFCIPALAPFGDELENSAKFQPLSAHVSTFQLSVRKYRAEARREGSRY